MPGLYLYFYLDGFDNMKKINWPVSIFTCVMGSFGALARWLQVNNAFEENTGLLISGAKSTAAVVIVCVFTALALLLLCFLSERQSQLKSGSQGLIWTVASAAAGIALAVGGVICLLTSAGSTYPTVYRVMGIFMLLSGGALPVFIRGMRAETMADTTWLCAVAPVAMCCFWLIVCYKQNAFDPTLWHFVTEVLTAAASAVALYFIAGYAFDSKNPLATLYLTNLAAFLCMVSLADGHEIWGYFLLIGLAIFFLTCSMLINRPSPSFGWIKRK